MFTPLFRFITLERYKVKNYFTHSVLALSLLISGFSPAVNAAENTFEIPPKVLRKFAEVYSAVKSQYVDSVDDEKFLKDAISSAVAGLDPHSNYLDLEGLKDFGTDIS